MSINTGRKYSILAYAGDGLSPNGIIPCLNVHGASNTVANGSKVTVYNDLQEISELWTLLPEANGNYRIKSLATPNPAGDYVLNYSTAASSLGSCTMWNKLEDSSGVDTIVKIEAVSGKTEIYTIKLVTAKNGAVKYLTASGRANSNSVTWSNASGTTNQQWKFINRGAMPPPPVKPTGNYAEYPCRPMHITQAYIGESHTGHSTGTPHDWPIDDNGIGGTRNYFYCPCDKMKIKRIYGVGKTGVNTIWMQSLEPVKLANGKTDFLVVMVIHPDDEDLLKLYEGQDVTRGQAMFREGTDGANNYHQHISCGLGDIVGTGWLNVPGTKYFVINTTNGPIKAEEVFYVDTSKTTILQTEGLVFKTF